MNCVKKARRTLASVNGILNRITEPPSNVKGLKARVQSQFLSGLSLIAVPLFVLAQFIGGEEPFGLQIYYLMAFLIFVVFLLNRTGHYNLAAGVNLLVFSLFPYGSLLLLGIWSASFSHLILVWIPITLLIGSYLLDSRGAALFIIIHNAAFALVLLFHPGVEFLRSDGFLDVALPMVTISILIFAGSWARQRHMTQLERMNSELAEKSRELDIYTSLLIHDIGNDLQVCLSSAEHVNDVILTDPAKAKEHLQTSIAVERRMMRLLRVFTEPQPLVRGDIVSMIEKVAEQAQSAHRNITITVTADNESRGVGIASRLLPMVFENLFRNCATHAGEAPVVEVSVERSGNETRITVRDDGPGVAPPLRDQLFERGAASTESAGLGLYLAKRIVEMHGGTVELVDEEERAGCEFLITLPSSHRVEST